MVKTVGAPAAHRLAERRDTSGTIPLTEHQHIADHNTPALQGVISVHTTDHNGVTQASMPSRLPRRRGVAAPRASPVPVTVVLGKLAAALASIVAGPVPPAFLVPRWSGRVDDHACERWLAGDDPPGGSHALPPSP